MDLISINNSPDYLLKNWSDCSSDSMDFISYDDLIQSDDEWLSLESLMAIEEF